MLLFEFFGGKKKNLPRNGIGSFLKSKMIV